MEQQEEPGSSLVDKSPQFVYVIKRSSENLTILLCSDHLGLTVPSHPLI